MLAAVLSSDIQPLVRWQIFFGLRACDAIFGWAACMQAFQSVHCICNCYHSWSRVRYPEPSHFHWLQLVASICPNGVCRLSFGGECGVVGRWQTNHGTLPTEALHTLPIPSPPGGWRGGSGKNKEPASSPISSFCSFSFILHRASLIHSSFPPSQAVELLVSRLVFCLHTLFCFLPHP